MTILTVSCLPHISPTTVENLEQCMLQVAFNSDPNCRSSTITGTAARLGTAAHRVLEAISKGAIPNDAEWNKAFEALWQHEIGRQERQVMTTPHEQHLGPANFWPYYGTQRAKLKWIAHQLWNRQLQRREKVLTRSAQAHPTAERHYRAFDNRMVGTADVVRPEPGGLLIEDYKTGTVIESDIATGEMVLRSRYRQQVRVGSVKRWIRQYRTTGSVAPKVRQHGNRTSGPQQYAALRAQVAQWSDATLEQHVATWAQTQGVRVSTSTMWRALTAIGWPLKNNAGRGRAG